MNWRMRIWAISKSSNGTTCWAWPAARPSISAILAGGLSTGGAFTKEFGKGRRAGLQRRVRTRSRLCRRLLRRSRRLRCHRRRRILARGRASTIPAAFALQRRIRSRRFAVVQMQEVAAEIADKKRRHLPLVPELEIRSGAAASRRNRPSSQLSRTAALLALLAETELFQFRERLIGALPHCSLVASTS